MSSGQRLAYPAYRTAEVLTGLLPEASLGPLARAGGTIAWATMRGRRRITQSHVQRVAGRTLSGSQKRRQSRAVFVSYARYWLDTLGLSRTSPSDLQRRVSVPDTDLQRIQRALDQGRGAILATPHFGSWDLGGAWLAHRGFPVTAVAERLRPEKLLDLFVRIRTEFGMQVLVKGPGVWEELELALEQNRIVVLVSDRDPRGRGVQVPFFDEPTTLPVGPGRLAYRHGSPVFPVVVLATQPHHHEGVVAAELEADQRVGEHVAVANLTSELASSFENLIRLAPEQWHLLQPNWPSDHRSAPTE